MKKYSKILILIFVILAIVLFAIFGITTLLGLFSEKHEKGFLSSTALKVDVYDEEYQKVGSYVRGTPIEIYEKEYPNENITYKKISLKGKKYYVQDTYVTTDKNKIVAEEVVYVRTNAVLYFDTNKPNILASIKKGTALKIIGYHTLNEDGSVDQYKIQYSDKQTGYIYAKYVVLKESEALENYNENGVYDIHKERTDRFGGGSAASLDYYKEDKIKIKGNTMPKEARTLYINGSSVKRMGDYIEFAKQNNINAFVIDIKENTIPAYASPVMKELSPSNYAKAVNTLEDYRSFVKEAKDAGIYLIGRITTFKDQYYAIDHNENAILDTRNNKPFSHNSSYWPTPYSREVWEYNVKIAVEAVKTFGFNEIQFDYVRFPDGTASYEKSGAMDMRNLYNEEKASAIQQFLMYARDEIHKVGAYISADVFGESANNYVTAYGQYWPAISNVVDVISAMPYPDHFNKNDYGFTMPVWTVPYQLLKTWGGYAFERQKETPSPAIVRTWIQAYNTIHEPYIVYDADKISEQIKGLYESGLTGGYITWNASSSLDKYKQIAPAFRKDYLNG